MVEPERVDLLAQTYAKLQNECASIYFQRALTAHTHTHITLLRNLAFNKHVVLLKQCNSLTKLCEFGATGRGDEFWVGFFGR